MELKYLNLKEAAAVLSVSTRTLANLATIGQITAYRLPSACNAKPRYRFRMEDIENFMNGNKLISVNTHTKKVFAGNKARVNIEAVKNYVQGRNI